MEILFVTMQIFNDGTETLNGLDAEFDNCLIAFDVKIGKFVRLEF